MSALPSAEQNALEAAAFRRLLKHLRERSDVQNIDLMNLSGFCRNCLSKWYLGAAEEQGQSMSYEQARTHIYGMEYQQWKALYQREAIPSNANNTINARKDNHYG